MALNIRVFSDAVWPAVVAAAPPLAAGVAPLAQSSRLIPNLVASSTQFLDWASPTEGYLVVVVNKAPATLGKWWFRYYVDTALGTAGSVTINFTNSVWLDQTTSGSVAYSQGWHTVDIANIIQSLWFYLRDDTFFYMSMSITGASGWPTMLWWEA